MIKLIDPDHPFYRPLMTRLIIVLFVSAWTAFEFYNGEMMWGYIFLAVSAYTACVLLIFYKPKPEVVEPAVDKTDP